MSIVKILIQNRKYVIRKINSSFSSKPKKRKKRKQIYDGYVKAALAELWEIFDRLCGQSASGLYVNTVSSADVAFGWWEGEAILGSGQEGSFNALQRIRKRTPFRWVHAHPDNDKSFINWHLFRYCEGEGIQFSRSRHYKKNDNNFVEQKNSTHIRGVIGHLRYDTEKELEVINNLYRNELRLYKNFFQPVMKLKEKIRDKGKVHRRYNTPKTPY